MIVNFVFLGAKAPLGLASVSKSVTNKKVRNFKFSQDFHVKSYMLRVTFQE